MCKGEVLMQMGTKITVIIRKKQFQFLEDIMRKEGFEN